MAELQFELWIGDAPEIRAKRVRKQKTDRQDPIKPRMKPDSPSVLDYPETMSQYERESLAAEAQLKAERKKKPPKVPQADSGLFSSSP